MTDEKFRKALHMAADDCLSGVADMPTQRRAVMERIDRMEQKSRAMNRKAALAPVLAAMMIVQFRKVDQLAARLQSPYLLWLTFAAYLNWGVWVLNG